MTAEDVAEHLRQRPFEPFRVYLSNGSSYEVRHPEMALLLRRQLIIAIDRPVGGVGERAVFCDLRQVTHIEKPNGASAEGR